jgi:hypothetical protein
MRPVLLLLLLGSTAAVSRAATRSIIAEECRDGRARLLLGATVLLSGTTLLSAALRRAARASAVGATVRGEVAGEPSSEPARELSSELTLQLDRG